MVALFDNCSYLDEFWFKYGTSIKSPWWAVFTVEVLFLFWILYQTKINWPTKKGRVIWVAMLTLPVMSMYGLHEFKRFMDFQRSGKSAQEFVQSLDKIQKSMWTLNCENRDINREGYCPINDFCEHKT